MNMRTAPAASGAVSFSHNMPPEELPQAAAAPLVQAAAEAVEADVLAAHGAEVEALAKRLAQITAHPITSETAPHLRDVMKKAGDRFAALETDRFAAQKPHTDALERIRADYRVQTDRCNAIKEDARKPLTAYLEEEDRKAKAAAAAAALAAAEAAAAAAQAQAQAEATGDVFDKFDAADADAAAANAQADATFAKISAKAGPTVGSASGLARAAGLRTTYDVEVVDGAKLVRHFAKHPDVIEAARKVAAAQARALKGAAEIPGAKVIETRKAS